MTGRGRSYAQYCGLAQALDIVGERWTLLLVRDLLLGPRRFGDLAAGLPGISTDLLTARLRTLESVGAVERRRLPPPASVTVYELTDLGRSLRRAVAELSSWGAQLLPPPGRDGYALNPAWAIQSIAARYRGGVHVGDYDLAVGDRVYTVHIADDRATVSDGPSTAPRATITATTRTFMMFIGGFVTLPEARRADLCIDGDRRSGQAILRLLVRSRRARPAAPHKAVGR